MQKQFFLFSFISLIILSTACSRKTIPQKQTSDTENNSMNGGNNKVDSVVVTAPKAPVKTVKISTPKSISVNDAVARKAVDGRLYYDLEGKRYWKNYKDGKYYLFNKNMTGNPDYKPRN